MLSLLLLAKRTQSGASGWLFTVIGIASVATGKVTDRFCLIFVGFEKKMNSHVEIWSDRKCPDLKLEKLRGVDPRGPHSHIVTVQVNCPVGWFPCRFPVTSVATLPAPPSPPPAKSWVCNPCISQIRATASFREHGRVFESMRSENLEVGYLQHLQFNLQEVSRSHCHLTVWRASLLLSCYLFSMSVMLYTYCLI